MLLWLQAISGLPSRGRDCLDTTSPSRPPKAYGLGFRVMRTPKPYTRDKDAKERSTERRKMHTETRAPEIRPTSFGLV